MNREELIKKIIELEPSAKQSERKTEPVAVEIPKDKLLPFMQKLRGEREFNFDMLVSHTAVDWVDKGQFELLYVLTSLEHDHFLMVSTSVPRENPIVSTVSSIWKIAEWQEREVYDFYGVLYDNHPDLRRLFLEDDWEGFPMRKDYKDDFILVPDEQR